jgi:nicotinate-nucleotide adenylyltransferase
MQIGLYFGSFNPVHTGHLIIAQHCLNQTEMQQVWFVVTPQNPFKTSATLLNEYDRLHLVRLGIGDHPNLKASDIEFHLPKPSYTSTTLTYLEEKYPQHVFSILMGSDSYQNLPNWHNAVFIMNTYPLYVYQRPGFPLDEASPPSKGSFLHAPFLDISASHIRGLLAAKKPITYLVPLAVEIDIEKNNYYRH